MIMADGEAGIWVRTPRAMPWPSLLSADLPPPFPEGSLALQPLLQFLDLFSDLPLTLVRTQEDIVGVFARAFALALHAVKAGRLGHLVFVQRVTQLFIGLGAGLLQPDFVFVEVIEPEHPKALKPFQAE